MPIVHRLPALLAVFGQGRAHRKSEHDEHDLRQARRDAAIRRPQQTPGEICGLGACTE